MTAGLEQVSRWPVRAAVAVVTADGVVARAGASDETFRWASVTKMLTTLAVLVAAEEGTVDLDDQAGPPGSTVRHLLAHASGLSRDGDAPPIPPGQRRVYSNRGIEVAAEHTERQAGMPFGAYLAEAVLEPLGLTRTRIEGSMASAGMGPLVDLAALATELLAPTVIAPATLAAATAVAFPGLDGILPGFGRQSPNDWGLGFELRDHKDPHWTGRRNSPTTFGHFGLAGSFCWVDPTAGVACVGLADTDFGPWAAEAWPRLADAVLETYTERR